MLKLQGHTATDKKAFFDPSALLLHRYIYCQVFFLVLSRFYHVFVKVTKQSKFFLFSSLGAYICAHF